RGRSGGRVGTRLSSPVPRPRSRGRRSAEGDGRRRPVPSGPVGVSAEPITRASGSQARQAALHGKQHSAARYWVAMSAEKVEIVPTRWESLKASRVQGIGGVRREGAPAPPPWGGG